MIDIADLPFLFEILFPRGDGETAAQWERRVARGLKLSAGRVHGLIYDKRLRLRADEATAVFRHLKQVRHLRGGDLSRAARVRLDGVLLASDIKVQEQDIIDEIKKIRADLDRILAVFQRDHSLPYRGRF